MPLIAPSGPQSCQRCGNALAPGALVCEKCHALVHSEELDRLASQARVLESQGDWREARERWLEYRREQLRHPTPDQGRSVQAERDLDQGLERDLKRSKELDGPEIE